MNIHHPGNNIDNQTKDYQHELNINSMQFHANDDDSTHVKPLNVSTDTPQDKYELDVTHQGHFIDKEFLSQLIKIELEEQELKKSLIKDLMSSINDISENLSHEKKKYEVVTEEIKKVSISNAELTHIHVENIRLSQKLNELKNHLENVYAQEKTMLQTQAIQTSAKFDNFSKSRDTSDIKPTSRCQKCTLPSSLKQEVDLILETSTNSNDFPSGHNTDNTIEQANSDVINTQMQFSFDRACLPIVNRQSSNQKYTHLSRLNTKLKSLQELHTMEEQGLHTIPTTTHIRESSELGLKEPPNLNRDLVDLTTEVNNFIDIYNSNQNTVEFSKQKYNKQKDLIRTIQSLKQSL